MSLSYSVIIPTYNEALRISCLIKQVQMLNPLSQVIVVDANSADQTAIIAQKAGAEVYHSSRGRGTQCALGARKAAGDILVFLHADSTLSSNAFTVIKQFFSAPDCQIARFRLTFDHPHWLLKFYAWWGCFDTVLTRFGDQGIIVRRSFYDSLGGIREWLLMEDVDFFRRARALSKIALLPSRITTSARKFTKTGLIRRQISNGLLLFRYLIGEPPEKLFKIYYSSESMRGSQ